MEQCLDIVLLQDKRFVRRQNVDYAGDPESNDLTINNDQNLHQKTSPSSPTALSILGGYGARIQQL